MCCNRTKRLTISNVLKGYVKKAGDLDSTITTQRVQQKNVTGKDYPDQSTMANICLKLNAKLGGVNNVIKNPRLVSRIRTVLGDLIFNFTSTL